MNNEIIILYDGLCNLCSGFIKFISKRKFITKPEFIPLHSKNFGELRKKYIINQYNDTVIIILDGKVYTKSNAIIKIFSKMKGIWNFGKYLIYIPQKLRNWIYNFIAYNRYKIFGKRKVCYNPNKD